MAVSSIVRLWWQSTALGEWMFLDFPQWCKFTPEFNTPSKNIVDRYGIVHQITPTTLAKKHRFPIAATMEPRPEDILESSDLTVAITAEDTGTDSFTLTADAGIDYTGLFPVGRTFTVASSDNNDGTYTVQSVSHGTGTTIVVVEEVTGGGGDLGNLVSSYVLPEVIDFWAIGNIVSAHTEFFIYHYEDGVDDDGADVQRRMAYRGRFSAIPPGIMGTLVFIDGQMPDMRMEFVITEDGTFDTYTNSPLQNDTSVNSYTVNPVARPT